MNNRITEYHFKKDSIEDLLKHMKQMYTTVSMVQIGEDVYDISDIVIGFECHSFHDGKVIFNGPAGTMGPEYKYATREIKIRKIHNDSAWDVLDAFIIRTRDDYDWPSITNNFNNDQLIIVARQAYEDGHSAGLNECVNYMYEYMSMAYEIIKLETKKEATK